MKDDFEELKDFSLLNIVMVATTLSCADYHGALAPFHAMENEKMERLIGSTTLLNNNISLIIVSIIEKYLNSHVTTGRQWVVIILQGFILSISIGIFTG